MSFRNSNRKRDIMNFSGNSFVTLLRCRLYTTAFFWRNGKHENDINESVSLKEMI